MPDPQAYLLFVAAALALLVTPGPAVLYIVGRSMDQGVGAGFVSALGLVAGGAVYVLATVAGVSALVMAAPGALRVLTLAGAAYLAWLGWAELRSQASPGTPAPVVGSRSPAQLFRQGLTVSLLNPKALLFFVAFLPQFVRPDGADPRLQMLALGGTFLALALCTDSLWAVAAGKAGAWLRAPGRVRVRRRISAAVYFVLAVAAAWPRP